MGKWFGPQTGDCSCCPQDCPHCSGSVPDQVTVTVANLADYACDACDDFDGLYTCDYYGYNRSFSFCTGGGGSSTLNLLNCCEWRSDCINVRSPTYGCAAVSAQMRVYLGEHSGTYYLAAILIIWNGSNCSAVTTGWVAFSNSYGSAPDCAAWSSEALGSLDKCVDGYICTYDGSTTFSLTAL